ncbi:MAG: hypothetical protein ACOH1Y_16315 [Propionicimonas sp.]
MRLLLEGPDLQALLGQIRMEYGEGARIIQAEKVRRGGVGGFFARERFNIQVEVSELRGTPPSAPEHSGSPVRSVMDLVDRLNQQEKGIHRNVVPTPQAPTPSRAPSAPAVHPATHAPCESPSETNDIHLSMASSPSVSTQSASFADVMARLEQGVDSQALTPGGGSSDPRLVPLAATVPQRAVLAKEPSKSMPPRRAPANNSQSSGASMAARAMRMGVPAHVLAGAEESTDVYRRLLEWVESRPGAPMIVSTPGQVIVVVGEITAAMPVAGVLARQLKTDPGSIHLAVSASSTSHEVPVGRLLSEVPAGRLLSGVSDIALRRSRWQHAAGSTIVVVEAGLPLSDRAWLTAAVLALAPTFTWAVAQASTKVRDVVSWASAVGNVDALALMNVQATGDPVTALAGPLPIGLLDGQRATVTRWMAMLTYEGEGR